MHRASNNFSFICRKYYISKLLAEVFPNKNKNSPSISSQTQKSKEELARNTAKNVTVKQLNKTKTPSIMYWLPKMYKIPIGARFIVTSKNCSTKPLFDVISKVSKMIFNHVETFHRKRLFYTWFKKFWVVETSF